MKRITVLLADDNRVVRKEFRKILELEDDLEVVGEAKDGRQAVAMVKRLRPEVVLMDIAMPRLNGFEATREILQGAPATRVVMLSAHSEDVYVKEATKSGAIGYLIKQACVDDVCGAIREVQKGHTCYSPSIPGRLHKRNGKKQMD